MRRSSCFALVCAVAAFAALGFLFFASQDRGARPMDRAEAERFLRSGQNMLSAGDANGIMNLFTADSRVLGTTPDKLRAALLDAIQEMNGRPLTAEVRNLTVKQENDSAFLTFDLDLNENQKGAAIHYFTSHMNVTLKKVSASHWFGLYRTTDWKISQMDADPPFGYLDR
jgi:ketosteroid isomerase-like protein